MCTPETTAVFHEMKLQVSNCSTMYFLSDAAPITLHTDASDYGVGGSLFQTVDGIDQPVAFISKSLNKSQLRWLVIQKEIYGIFQSCMYLQWLLRDRMIQIRTDHRILLFIKEASNPMIVWWYMTLDEFSFTLEFILSIRNGNTTAMSRLCRKDMIDGPTEHTENIFYQLCLCQINQTIFNTQRLASCTTRKLATLDLNAHLDVSRCWEMFSSFNASMSDTSLTIALIVGKWAC